MEKTIKIAKYLSECGVASRRKSETLVLEGHIAINGVKSRNVAQRINPKTDRVEFNGKKIAPLIFVYYLLNKPLGYTCTTEDNHAKNLITELVPSNPPVWPVGRLDKFTSGLILLTNDGNLTQKLTHPSHEVEKEYEIISNSPLEDFEIKKIQRGVKLEDGFIKPDRFEKIDSNHYRTIIHSGKKRVVRRLIENVGHGVSQLKRIRISFLTIGDLKVGQWRPLTKSEISELSA